MEKLMKPAEYAKELGISRQAVYAKIKRGGLTAKSVEGKLYIVVDNLNAEETNVTEATKAKVKATNTVKTTTTPKQTMSKDHKALLEAKDETIAVLKGTVKDLKKSNKQISTTLRGVNPVCTFSLTKSAGPWSHIPIQFIYSSENFLSGVVSPNLIPNSRSKARAILFVPAISQLIVLHKRIIYFPFGSVYKKE